MGSTKVSLLDHKSVKGNSVTGQVNQQWTFIPFGNGTYAIQSMLPSRAGGPLYLSMSGKVVVMSSIPIGWNVDDEEGGLRIKWPKTDWTVDLNYGSSDPHTKIHLVNYKPPERAQMWSYARCSFDNIDIPSNAISQGVDELIPHAVIEKTGVLYLLQNWEKDAVLDVFSADNRSVKCWSCKHRERNQQFGLVRSGKGCAIRSMWQQPGDSCPLYVTVQGPVRDGASIVVTPYPVTWDVSPMFSNTQAVCFAWPDTQLVITLGDKEMTTKYGDCFKVSLSTYHPNKRSGYWRTVDV